MQLKAIPLRIIYKKKKNKSSIPHTPKRFYFIKSTNQYFFDESILYLIDLYKKSDFYQILAICVWL